MYASSVVRSSIRRALALLIGCVLAVSWVGSARAMCAMTSGHRMDAAADHAVARGTAMPGMPRASAHPMGPMDAAMMGHAPASHPRGDAPNDDGCPMHGRGNSPCTAPAPGSSSGTTPSGTMPADCAVAAHCAALTVALVPPVVATDAGTIRVTRVSADGPLLGASEAADEPTAPPPRG